MDWQIFYSERLKEFTSLEVRKNNQKNDSDSIHNLKTVFECTKKDQSSSGMYSSSLTEESSLSPSPLKRSVAVGSSTLS